MRRPQKLENVIALAIQLILKGSYVVSIHAKLRQGERVFSIADIKNIICTGFHEKKKDGYKEEYADWNYAIRGKTLDSEDARVCIAFIEKSRLIVVTVIRLER